MKYLFYVMFFISFWTFSPIIFSQTTDFQRRSSTYEFFDGVLKIKKITNTQTNSSSYTTENYYTFGTSISGNTKTEYGAIFRLTLPQDLPENYYVKKVEFLTTKEYGNNYVLGFATGLGNTLEEGWNIINNSTCLGTYESWHLDYYEIPSLIELIQNVYDAGESVIYLSFKDDVNNTNSTLIQFNYITIQITYGIKINYIVQNNFGAGKILVNGEEKNHNETVKLKDYSINTFTAIEPQDYAGNTYLWNDTEGSNNKSKWQIQSSWVLLLIFGKQVVFHIQQVQLKADQQLLLI